MMFCLYVLFVFCARREHLMSSARLTNGVALLAMGEAGRLLAGPH